jgi:hypothetical protein
MEYLGVEVPKWNITHYKKIILYESGQQKRSREKEDCHNAKAPKNSKPSQLPVKDWAFINSSIMRSVFRN